MSGNLHIRAMLPEEAGQVSDLVLACFRRFVAPGYSQLGRQVFGAYAAAEALRDRQDGSHFTLVAMLRGRLAGMVELRGASHVSMLFVDGAFHRRGVAKALLAEAVARSRTERPGLARLDVNASPYAVEIYRRMGFRPLGAEEERDGLRFTRMEKVIDPPCR